MSDNISKRVDMICRLWEERQQQERRAAEQRAAQAKAAPVAPPPLQKRHVTFVSRKELHK